MKNVQIKCDSCGKDLSTTSNCEAYRIILTSERITPKSGNVTAMLMYADFEIDHHFCGIKCLTEFLFKKGYLNEYR